MNKYKELVEAGAPELRDGFYYNVSDDGYSKWGYDTPYVVRIERRGRPTYAAWPLYTLNIVEVAGCCKTMMDLMANGGNPFGEDTDELLGNHGPDVN